MATTAIPIVPSNTVLPGSHPLRTAQFPATPSDGSRPLLKSLPSVKDIVSGWISSANGLLSATQTPSSALFVKEAYWRDLLCMTWDFRTIQGPQRIADFIAASSPDHRICHVSLDESADYKVPKATQLGDIQVIQAFLHVETYTGRGRGLVRLVPDIGDGSSWKAYTLFTSLEELKGHEEKIHTRRPTGHEAEEANTDWKTQLNKQHNYEGAQQPTVLIIGESRR